MKIALYIEDGLEQIILTPDSETEKAILGKVHDGSRALDIQRGAFYGCRGGWTRWKQSYGSLYSSGREEDESTMIVLRPAIAAPPEPDHKPGLMALFADHYWDTFEQDKELILAHVRSVLGLSFGENEDGK